MLESEIDLTGTIDFHLHTAPDVRPRKLDDFEAARQAAARGMRVFGGLALNAPVGGLNPAAVEIALAMGAAQIWMPTESAAAEPQPKPAPGLSILGEAGLKPEVLAILRLIAEHNAILGTGHL